MEWKNLLDEKPKMDEVVVVWDEDEDMYREAVWFPLDREFVDDDYKTISATYWMRPTKPTCLDPTKKN